MRWKKKKKKKKGHSLQHVHSIPFSRGCGYPSQTPFFFGASVGLFSFLSPSPLFFHHFCFARDRNCCSREKKRGWKLSYSSQMRRGAFGQMCVFLFFFSCLGTITFDAIGAPLSPFYISRNCQSFAFQKTPMTSEQNPQKCKAEANQYTKYSPYIGA